MSPIKFYSGQKSPCFLLNFSNGEKVDVMPVLFDSGADALLDLPVNIFKNLMADHLIVKADTGYGSASIGVYGNADSSLNLRGFIPNASISGYPILDMQVESTTGNGSRVGMKLLGKGNVIVDYSKRKFYFEPFKDSIRFNGLYWPINFTIVEGRLCVGIVWEPSLKGKLNIGDEVLEINGVALAKLTECELFRGFSSFLKDEKATVKIKREGQIVEVEMEAMDK